LQLWRQLDDFACVWSNILERVPTEYSVNFVAVNQAHEGAAGVYIVIRSIFDKRSEEELKYYEALQRLAQEKGMDVAEYACRST
jgi:hypothetical protein